MYVCMYRIIYTCIYTYIGGKAYHTSLVTLLDKTTYYIFDKINKRVKCYIYIYRKSYQLVANSQGSPLIFLLQNKYEHDVFT